MKRILAIIVLAASSLYAQAQDEWARLAVTESSVHDVNVKSLTLAKTPDGEVIVVALFRVTLKVNSETLSGFEYDYVTLDDCAAREGKLSTVSTEGKLLYQNDFKAGDKTVATGIAAFLCNGAAAIIRRSRPGVSV